MLVCAFGGLWTEMYGYICTYVFGVAVLDKVYGKFRFHC